MDFRLNRPSHSIKTINSDTGLSLKHSQNQLDTREKFVQQIDHMVKANPKLKKKLKIPMAISTLTTVENALVENYLIIRSYRIVSTITNGVEFAIELAKFLLPDKIDLVDKIGKKSVTFTTVQSDRMAIVICRHFLPDVATAVNNNIHRQISKNDSNELLTLLGYMFRDIVGEFTGLVANVFGRFLDVFLVSTVEDTEMTDGIDTVFAGDNMGYVDRVNQAFVVGTSSLNLVNTARVVMSTTAPTAQTPGQMSTPTSPSPVQTDPDITAATGVSSTNGMSTTAPASAIPTIKRPAVKSNGLGNEIF